MVRRAYFVLLPMLFISLLVTTTGHGQNSLELFSPAFKDGARIPNKYVMQAIGGENISPPISWKNPPAGTKSFAISMVDPHPFAKNWVHWMIINIPFETSSLEEGSSGREMPKGSVELLNSYGSLGYGGPQPPPGTGQHPYVITVYALKVEKLDLTPETTLGDFKKALSGKILGEASITGYYEQ